MPKFSIVIPVYNVEEYIGRCLESVKNQTFKDYEVIVVNDGCTDKSIEVAKQYDVKIIKTEHVSVSEARNIGVKHTKGEYLIFLDSDDYWDNELLNEINKSLNNNPDLVRFQVRTVTDTGDVKNYKEKTFTSLSGKQAFDEICRFHFVESIWCYAIKRKYYITEKYEFKKGKIHEDFGLTPLIIIKAKKVNSISYIGYNYYRRSGSIMNTLDYNWTKKKVDDFYSHYKWLKSEIEKTNIDGRIFKSFIANSLIQKICELNNSDYKMYRKKLNDDNVYEDLLTDNIARKMKKTMLKISPKLFFKIKK